MAQLIMTVLAIALMSATVLASVNYLPWWAGSVEINERAVRSALVKLETAYVVNARLYAQSALDPNGDTDGGLMSLYGATLGFAPGAPPGYIWVYGKQTASGSYLNTHYFCLRPSASLPSADQHAVRALRRAAQGYSTQQFIVSTACGAVAQGDVSSAAPFLTFYVRPVPDVGL